MARRQRNNFLSVIICILTINESFKSEWIEQKNCYEWCSPFIHGSTHDRIIVEDRGGDDEKSLFMLCRGYTVQFSDKD